MSFIDKNIVNDQQQSKVNEPQADYEKAEREMLREALLRTDTERFLFATMLYKVQQTMKKAIITINPDTLSK